MLIVSIDVERLQGDVNLSSLACFQAGFGRNCRCNLVTPISAGRYDLTQAAELILKPVFA